jgi:hypothetical protein
MSQVGIVAGEKLLIKIGDDENPETLAHPCLINTTREIAFSAAMSETQVADCSDPSAPASVVRRVVAVDFTVTGAGKTHKDSVLEYIQWQQSGAARNVEITQDLAGDEGGWTGTGAMYLSAFQTGGARGEYQDCQLTLVPADSKAFTWEATAT